MSMDINRHGKQVPNNRCPICAESTEDVAHEEHAKHVDFIAARGLAHGYHTPAPSPEVWAAEYAALREEER